MRRIKMLAVASGVLAITAISSAIAQSPDEHKMIQAQDIKWSPGPPSLPAGVQLALLYGDASKDGMFVVRFKVSKGYRVPPHYDSLVAKLIVHQPTRPEDLACMRRALARWCTADPGPTPRRMGPGPATHRSLRSRCAAPGTRGIRA